MKIKIIGAGLIGTSMGLGLRTHGHSILFKDISVSQQKIAQDLVGASFLGEPDLVVIATPVESVFASLKAEYELYPQAMFIDVSGLKYELIAQVEKFPELSERFVGTHPMAGREVSGATSARADLFEGRTWIITPTHSTSEKLLDTVLTLVDQLGASSVERAAEEHDHSIALVSHLPQVMSSLTASALSTGEEHSVALAGQGLRDVTRLAESAWQLWRELLIRNKKELLPILQTVAGQLNNVITAIAENNSEALEEFLKNGNSGRARIPGKHGGNKRDYFFLPIVIDDKPGQLAKIVDECAQANVNIEDLNIEHSPGQETGLITLALSKEDSKIMYKQLSKNGWRVHEAFTHG